MKYKLPPIGTLLKGTASGSFYIVTHYGSFARNPAFFAQCVLDKGHNPAISNSALYLYTDLSNCFEIIKGSR